MPRPRSLPPLALLALALAPWLSTACDSAESKAKAVAEDAEKSAESALEASKDKAAELGDQAKDGAIALGKDALDASKQAASDLADATKEGAKVLFEDVRNDGELSHTAKSWIVEQAADSTPSIETVLVKGVQLAPVALEASAMLAEAVDKDTAVEPIFQKADEDPAALDAKIADMPRVETVEGVTVGFKQVSSMTASEHVKEEGYLVIWRHEEYLVGFIYRSKRSIDLDTVVAQTPRLIRLTQRALDDEG